MNSNYTTITIPRTTYVQLAQIAKRNDSPISGMVTKLVEDQKMRGKIDLKDFAKPVLKNYDSRVIRRIRKKLKNFDSTKIDYSYLAKNY